MEQQQTTLPLVEGQGIKIDEKEQIEQIEKDPSKTNEEIDPSETFGEKHQEEAKRNKDQGDLIDDGAIDKGDNFDEDLELDDSVRKIRVHLETRVGTRSKENENGEDCPVDTYNDFRSFKIMTSFHGDLIKCQFYLKSGSLITVDDLQYVFLFASLPVKFHDQPIIYVSRIINCSRDTFRIVLI